MKFLCVACDEKLELQKPTGPEEGSLSLSFQCPSCGHEIAMLTNAGETKLVQSLGVHFGRNDGPTPPMVGLRANLVEVRPEVLIDETSPEPVWTEAAEARLMEHPKFVQPVIRKTYSDYARRKGLSQITPEVMDEAYKWVGSK